MSIVKIEDEKLKQRLDSTGVVIEYVSYYIDEQVDYALHKLIAIKGMEDLQEQRRLWALNNVTKDLKFEDFFQIIISDYNPIGKLVSVDEFMGTRNAFKVKTSDTTWTIPNTDGYMTAFYNPPYDLNGDLEKHKKLFDAVNKLLFNPMSDNNLKIYEWSTDWSNFFDAGKEWWGTFYWTVYNKEKSYVIVVAASSTD